MKKSHIDNGFNEYKKRLVKKGWPAHAFDNPIEIISGIWLSGIGFSNDIPSWCYKNNFTHILNAAGSYNKVPFYYTHPNNHGIKYLELNMNDTVGFNLNPFLLQIYNFLEDAINNKGKILIHCVWGQSRSVSCLIYYIMVKWKLKYNEALKIVRSRRFVAQPNEGFEVQLKAIEYYN